MSKIASLNWITSDEGSTGISEHFKTLAETARSKTECILEDNDRFRTKELTERKPVQKLSNLSFRMKRKSF